MAVATGQRALDAIWEKVEENERLDFEDGLVLMESDDLLQLEIDVERSQQCANACVHETRRSSIALTRPVARRAAETGVRPLDLPARYAAEKASPQPVGSVATGHAPIVSQRPLARTREPFGP